MSQQPETHRKRAAGATKPTAEVKGRLVDFAWQLKKDGYADSSIKTYTTIIHALVKRNVNVFNPEHVKEFLAKQELNSIWKRNIITAYTTFLRKNGIYWKPPTCDVIRKLPFIPTEKELDDLIASCGKKMAPFLQLLKETGMRCGEAINLEWTDIDFERKIITLNKPEKKGKPRICNASKKLIGMLNGLPKISKRLFPSSANSKRAVFNKTRKKAAKKLQNPRLLRIKFHTFRHWKATTLYHQTKDILYVKESLGHRRIDTTLLYVQLEKALFKEITDEFTVKVAKTPNEIQDLLEVGFEYVCEKDDLTFFRKRR